MSCLAGGALVLSLAVTQASAQSEDRRCIGPIAQATPPLIHQAAWSGTGPARRGIGPLRLDAALKPDEVRLTYIGHSTFLIESAKGVTIETDYNDHVRSGTVPRIATMNRAHSTHYSAAPNPNIAHVLPGWNPAGGMARHRMQVEDVFVFNVPTNIRNFGGTDYNSNSIFVFETAGLCIGHLGHLHHTLTDQHRKELGRIDVLLVPVDGGYTMDIEGMIEVIDTLQSAMIVPMHYFSESTLSRFLDRMRERYGVERRTGKDIVISRATLPVRPTVVVLPGR
jgi:L-ascorbate metabolism protein UlaG (beta-lactamase superfamily)